MGIIKKENVQIEFIHVYETYDNDEEYVTVYYDSGTKEPVKVIWNDIEFDVLEKRYPRFNYYTLGVDDENFKKLKKTYLYDKLTVDAKLVQFSHAVRIGIDKVEEMFKNSKYLTKQELKGIIDYLDKVEDVAIDEMMYDDEYEYDSDDMYDIIMEAEVIEAEIPEL
jgi:hypothetical protein